MAIVEEAIYLNGTNTFKKYGLAALKQKHQQQQEPWKDIPKWECPSSLFLQLVKKEEGIFISRPCVRDGVIMRHQLISRVKL